MKTYENISPVADATRAEEITNSALVQRINRALRNEITSSALVQRINRALRKEGEQLHKLRGERGWSDLGDYYIVDFYRNFIVASHVDLESLGRELGVLRESERLAEN